MKLNEVFGLVFEDVYNDTSDIEPYKVQVDAYFKKKRFLYRGMPAKSDVILGDANTMNRKSGFSSPFVNWYVDFLDSRWEKFPKRTKSFICTTDKSYARGYGRIFFAIPLDGQEMAVAPSTDFFDGFTGNGLASVGTLNDVLLNSFSLHGLPSSTPQQLKQSLSALDDIIAEDPYAFEKEFKDIEVYQRDVAEAISNNGSILKYLHNVIEPSKFTITKDIPKTHSEVWLGGKVLFISYDYASMNGFV